MPRTTIPDLTFERLVGRLANYLNRGASDLIETLIWTVQTCGFDRQILSDLLAEAAKEAGEQPDAIVARYLPAQRSMKRARSNGPE